MPASTRKFMIMSNHISQDGIKVLKELARDGTVSVEELSAHVNMETIECVTKLNELIDQGLALKRRPGMYEITDRGTDRVGMLLRMQTRSSRGI